MNQMAAFIRRRLNTVLVGLGLALVCAGLAGWALERLHRPAPTIAAQTRRAAQISFAPTEWAIEATKAVGSITNGRKSSQPAGSFATGVIDRVSGLIGTLTPTPTWKAEGQKDLLSLSTGIQTPANPAGQTILPFKQQPLRPQQRTATPMATATPTAKPEQPTHLSIPSIELDAPVVLAEESQVSLYGIRYQQWLAPNKAVAGWQGNSARLGEPGNTVLTGHNNIYGQVFAHLEDLEPGAEIVVQGEMRDFHYQVVAKLIFEERYQPEEVRLNNARWIMPTSDERLTLVTCWPANSNSHRLIIVAIPAPT